MRFSILVPVYRAEAYLPAAVESVLRQDYQDYELLLLEDGSPDGCGALCDALAAAHPERIRSLRRPHQGTVWSRRELIAEAKGEYCLWLDSDDLLKEGALSLLAEKLEADPGLDGILYDLSFFTEGEAPQDRPHPLPTEKVIEGDGKRELYELLIGGNTLDSLCIKLLRTSLLQQDPSDYSAASANPFGEDVLHCLYPLTRARRLLALPRSLYLYRMHQGSVMHRFDPATLDRRLNLAKPAFFAPFLREWGLDDQPHRDRLAASGYKGVLDGVLYFLEEETHRKEARAYGKDFARKHPEMKQVASSSALPRKLRLILGLFARGRIGLLEQSLKLYRKLR